MAGTIARNVTGPYISAPFQIPSRHSLALSISGTGYSATLEGTLDPASGDWVQVAGPFIGPVLYNSPVGPVKFRLNLASGTISSAQFSNSLVEQQQNNSTYAGPDYSAAIAMAQTTASNASGTANKSFNGVNSLVSVLNTKGQSDGSQITERGRVIWNAISPVQGRPTIATASDGGYWIADVPNRQISSTTVGAVGDGGADDTSALQKMFASDVMAERDLRIAKGAYLVNQTFSITSVNPVIIRGSGAVATQIIVSADVDAFVIDAPSVTLENIQIIYNVKRNGAAVTIKNATALPGVVTNNLTIRGDIASAFELIGCNDTRHHNLTLKGPGRQSLGNAVHITANMNASTNHYFSALHVYDFAYAVNVDNNVSPGVAGRTLPGVEGILLVHPVFEGVSRGVWGHNAFPVSYAPPQISVIGGHTNTRDVGFYVEGNWTQMQYIGHLIYLASGDNSNPIGFFINDAADFQMIGCQVQQIDGGTGSAPDGIPVRLTNCTNPIIEGNFLGHGSTGTKASIELVGSTTGARISGNSRRGGIAGSPLVLDNSTGTNSCQPEGRDVAVAASGGVLNVSKVYEDYALFTSGANITSLVGRPGQTITLQCDSAITVVRSASLLLRNTGNYTFTPGATLTLVNRNGAWRETARQDA